MSIQNEINRIQAALSNTYSVLEGYGATMPETQNSDNLAATAATVPVAMSGTRSVRYYGAKGDGSTDDTAAFQTALAENRIVSVPGGTYILSDTLLVEENCCLELSQDTVLKFTQTNSPCISLLRLAYLKGNKATIFVNNAFDSKVINCDTRDCESNMTSATANTAVPPFIKWDPQWKMSRYVTDINICKPNSYNNMTCDSDLVCYGTGVFMGCYNTSFTGAQPFMWGVLMSGVRIAGGFTYGIHVYDEAAATEDGTDRWNHDMRIEAVIEGCETGVCLERCNLAHLNVTIQPRPYWKSTTEQLPYAKYGVKLVDSKWVDLSSSYVWDWTTANTLVGTNAEYQHIAMYGNCSGVNIYDASATNSNYFWQRIYYDNPVSMLSATVHGAKGKIPIDPKYAFYKNYRTGGYDYQNDNVSWRDYHNMTRYDVPVTPQNAYTYPNRLYRIGSFTIGSEAENPVSGFTDTLAIETVTIEENGYYGLMGWSNLFCGGSSIQHYWCPLGGVYESRVPVYFYSKSGNTYTIYRLVTDMYDVQHIYNCRVSITNSRRFIFDFADMGAIANLDTTNTYLRITPALQTGTPKFKGQFAMINDKPVVCTSNASWNAAGAISTAATTKQLATMTDVDTLSSSVDNKLENLSITSEQTDFVIPADGSYVQIPEFTDAKGTYQDGYVNLSGTVTARSGWMMIEPRAFSSGDVIRIRGLEWEMGSGANYGIVTYFTKSTGVYKQQFNLRSVGVTTSTSGSGNVYANVLTYNWDATTKTLTLTFTGSNAASFCNAYTWGFSGKYASGYNASSVIMTVNEEITYHDEWQGEPKRLDESLYAQNVMLTSPNGSIFKLSVSDSGTLTAVAL